MTGFKIDFAVFAGPTVLLENVLDPNQFAGVTGDVETNRISDGLSGKLIATMAAIAQVADLAQACLVRLRAISRRAALARKSVTERQARRHTPWAALESRHGVKIRARHCPV